MVRFLSYEECVEEIVKMLVGNNVIDIVCI